MKTTVILLSLSLMVACSPADDRARDSAGRIEKILPEVCLNGVVYYANYNGYHTSYAPKFLPDSTVATCD
jgi:hypothetical protein